MFLLRGEILIPPRQPPHFGPDPGPLAPNVSQRLEHGKVEIHGRHSQLVPQAASRHLVLDGVAGGYLGKAPYAPVTGIDIVLHLPEVLRNLQELPHVPGGHRIPAVLADCPAHGIALSVSVF